MWAIKPWTQVWISSSAILFFAGCVWLSFFLWFQLELSGRVTCLCIISRGHTLCSSSSSNVRGEGELTCKGSEHTLGRYSGIASSIAAPCHHYSPHSDHLMVEKEEMMREGRKNEKKGTSNNEDFTLECKHFTTFLFFSLNGTINVEGKKRWNIFYRLIQRLHGKKPALASHVCAGTMRNSWRTPVR